MRSPTPASPRPHDPQARITRSRHTRPRRVAMVGLLSALVLGALSIPGVATAETVTPTYDGSTQATAAASCWEIKQGNTAAADGVYWIVTPQLQAPTRIYCDMTTDGGGWELIGRGRENWTYNYDGKGTPDQVSSVVTGQAAFVPRQLDSNLINGLLGGRRFDSYSDGVRVRRATNQTGTTWQETRFTYTSRDRWTWALGAGIPIDTVNLGGVTGTKTTTREFGSDAAYSDFWTYDDRKNDYIRGFNFGQNAIGSTAAESYIYSKVANGYYGTPFSQVFIRPKLLTSDVTYAAIPDQGTAAQTIQAAPRSGSIPTQWGVTGTGAAGAGENATEVQAFAQIGNTMYVGGNFTTVQRGASATGSDKIAQPYLAAFDATTGAYLSRFKPPVLNNQVKSLAALPDGRLVVGGEFTTVNGAARSGLIVVNSSIGTLDTTWTTNPENRLTGGKVSVRGLDTGGGYLYLTGSFTHFVRGTSAIYAKAGARISLSTGIVDKSWNPEFNGTGTALDVSDDGTAVYFSGYFTAMKSTNLPADRAAAISTATGANKVAGWQPTFSTSGSARYQQAVKQVGNKVWLGGSQHSMFAYDPKTFQLVNSSITKSGGDLQAITGGNGLVFGGCHCENWNYSDTTNYDSGTTPGSTNVSWSQADKIYYVGAWDATTGAYVPDFTPEMRARNGMGAWALRVATDGTLWAGGSITSAVSQSGRNQWIGGFARFAVRPHTAPASPTDLTASVKGTDASVSWSASATAGVTYELIRNNRVVATTSGTSIVLPGASSSDRYVVRAVDLWNNRSASTSVVMPAVSVTPLAGGSTWSYYVDGSTPVASGWSQDGFDYSSWKTGTAPLGWGTSGPIATNVDVIAGQTRPLASYFRSTFAIDDPSAFSTYTLTTRADDGIVVYVNGAEVGRSNMPAGVVTPGTYASSAPSTATALKSPVVLDIPATLLRAGANSIAVEVHSNYRATPNTSMDLSIVAKK